jgi:hypothetical protein
MHSHHISLNPGSAKRAVAHIGVLSIETGDEIELVSLLIFICNMEGIHIQRTLVDLEAGLICDPITVSQCRWSRMGIPWHKDRGRRDEKRAERKD